MQYHFSVLMSISLLTLVPVTQAAQRALVTTKFKTEADIPTSVTRSCMWKGFTFGLVQQVATFGVAAATAGNKEKADIAACGLIAQWPGFLVASLGAYNIVSNDIQTLKEQDNIAASWVHNEVMAQDDKTIPYYAFLQQYKDQRSGVVLSQQACESEKIYAAYNKLLERYIKRRSYIGGYAVASALGPLPSFALLYALITLGLGK